MSVETKKNHEILTFYACFKLFKDALFRTLQYASKAWGRC